MTILYEYGNAPWIKTDRLSSKSISTEWYTRNSLAHLLLLKKLNALSRVLFLVLGFLFCVNLLRVAVVFCFSHWLIASWLLLNGENAAVASNYSTINDEQKKRQRSSYRACITCICLCASYLVLGAFISYHHIVSERLHVKSEHLHCYCIALQCFCCYCFVGFLVCSCARAWILNSLSVWYGFGEWVFFYSLFMLVYITYENQSITGFDMLTNAEYVCIL